MARGNQHTFARVPSANIPRSQFDRSHGNKLTFEENRLVPIYVDEAVPGDTFNLKMSALCRMATPIHPLMDNLYLDTFFFAVPNRLVWDNWEKFNGAQDNPGDSTDYLVPTVTWPTRNPNTLADYMGIPTGVAGDLTVDSLHFRAYNLIYNEWFRDENLVSARNVPTDDGPDDSTDYSILRRGKRHDYFTSALPWPQKGDPVALPLGTTAPVVPAATDPTPRLKHAGSGDLPFVANDSANDTWGTGPNSDYSSAAATWSTSGLETDLTNATAATINEIREAFQVQRMQERDARGGTRYTEILRSHFGVISPDARLQRPEFLGGGSARINVRQVEQTSETGTTPLGTLAAYATGMINGHGFTKSFTEHCVIIGLCNVRADLTYQQGIHRMWNRRTRYDFYWPALAHIGEQAIASREIYADGTVGDEEIFGFQERFAEYRYAPNRLCGEFRSSAPETLDSWHVAQEFTSRPHLNSEFILLDTPIDRVTAVQGGFDSNFIMDCHFNLKCARPMPLFGVPGWVDHF